ncbi:MAG TPA: ribosomal-processing cysteine protease Prp [Eubacteriales bacterium]|jgi:uncharacterized protein YsxB (DUF464 family)|nr:ribosomal-processing cysteine protease Prp [Clostridia bacterium]HRR89441.1 ribosomal-processing cysteine protease Prp [Eubacteriales bacterium]HRU84801.1 ribosomal-processing cysteine protease Prp [Eubacteriales bacterium]
MTSLKFITENGSVTRFYASGHTGYADEGEDIVCAALSAIMQTAILGLLKVAMIEVAYSSDEVTGKLSVELPKNLTERQRRDADVILNTLLLGVSDLSEGYSDYIDLEVI